MNFHTQYERDPSFSDAMALAEYTASDADRGGAVVGPSGVEFDQDDLTAWATWASRQDMTRSHSAAFANDHAVDELAEAGREVADDFLEGEWFVGVHTSNQGNNHLHVAQAGSSNDLYMDSEDVYEFREALAERIGEPYS